MCGRFTLTVDPEELMERFHLSMADAPLAPRYNIAPTQNAAVVLNASPDRLSLVRWGLIPVWATDPSIGAQMINARSETLAVKPAFRAAFKKRRCLVLSWFQLAPKCRRSPLGRPALERGLAARTRAVRSFQALADRGEPESEACEGRP